MAMYGAEMIIMVQRTTITTIAIISITGMSPGG